MSTNMGSQIMINGYTCGWQIREEVMDGSTTQQVMKGNQQKFESHYDISIFCS